MWMISMLTQCISYTQAMSNSMLRMTSRLQSLDKAIISEMWTFSVIKRETVPPKPWILVLFIRLENQTSMKFGLTIL